MKYILGNRDHRSKTDPVSLIKSFKQNPRWKHILPVIEWLEENKISYRLLCEKHISPERKPLKYWKWNDRYTSVHLVFYTENDNVIFRVAFPEFIDRLVS